MKNNIYKTFDDVLILPQFSTIKSRKDVNISTTLGSLKLALPIISSNMDTITESNMAIAMAKSGGIGMIHRFSDIPVSIEYFKQTAEQDCNCIMSVGMGEFELDRAKSLYVNGSRMLCIDVAHGAQIQVAEQYKRIKDSCPDAYIIIGNFGTYESILDFVGECGYTFISDFDKDGAIKVGIGPGSACTTRIKTGCGIPQLSAIMECSKTGVPIIADGGMRTSGDIAKALAAGARAVMLGGMLAGTDETPGELIYTSMDDARRHEGIDLIFQKTVYKLYRGSASKESYKTQGKDWSCAEGDSFTVPYKGPVSSILKDIEGGIRSAFTYVGASNLEEFQQKAKFIDISTNSVLESEAHGKSK